MDDLYDAISRGYRAFVGRGKRAARARLRGTTRPDASADMEHVADAYDAMVASASVDDVHTGGTTTRVNDFVNRGDEFDALYVFPPLLEACCRIIGRGFKLSSMHARTLRPHTPAQELHVDVDRASADWPLVGFILMIDEFRPDNGATRFVPGTHHGPDVPEAVMTDRRADYDGQLLATGPAGSLIIFNGSTWHGQPPNTSDGSRRSIQGAFIPRDGRAATDFAGRMRPETRARLGPLAHYVLAIRSRRGHHYRRSTVRDIRVVVPMLFMVPLMAASAQSPSNPDVRFIAVDSGVAVQTVDFGGVGRPVLFLPGKGVIADKRSVADFARALRPHFHVYSMTRRGFPPSSVPNTGYTSDRLADDVLAVMDSLGLQRPILIGHSMAGGELSSDRLTLSGKVAGLVYLDAGNRYALYDTVVGDFQIDKNEAYRHLSQLLFAPPRDQKVLVAQLLDTDLPALMKTLSERRKTLSTQRTGVPSARGAPRARRASVQPGPGVDCRAAALHAHRRSGACDLRVSAPSARHAGHRLDGACSMESVRAGDRGADQGIRAPGSQSSRRAIAARGSFCVQIARAGCHARDSSVRGYASSMTCAQCAT